jgi:uncharacterized iron-regulated membrane protein
MIRIKTTRNMGKFFSWLHRYVGLVAAAVLAMSGCTGAFITFSGEIDRVTRPDLRKVEPQPASASVDSLVAGARLASPRHPVRMVVFPESSRDAVEIWYRGSSLRAYANPHDGHVIGVRDTHDSLMGIFIDLHTNLLSGETGRTVIGGFGLAAIMLIFLGIWLWWPKRGRWRSALTVKWGAAPVRVWLDVHKLAGILTSVFLVVIAATGSALALSNVITEPLLVALTGERAARPAPSSAHRAGPSASLDIMVDQARATFPEGRVTRLMMPATPEGPVTVRVRLPGEIHQLGRTFVFFDQYDGALLRTDVVDANLATRINAWFYPLHTGFYGGVATRLLNIVFGVSLTLISLSGCWMWVRKTSAKKRAEKRKRFAV